MLMRILQSDVSSMEREDMEKVINEAGKKAIEVFVKENLSGHVSDETVKSYIEMARNRMMVHGGLPSLEISMCFSLTGTEEYLELEPDEVTYKDCVFNDSASLSEVFGAELIASLGNARVYEKRSTESGKRYEASVIAVYDGYRFSVTAVKFSEEGKVSFYEVKCLGPDGMGQTGAA